MADQLVRGDPSGQPLRYVDQGDGTFTDLISTKPLQASVQRINAGYVAPGQSAKTFIGAVATSTTVITTVNLYTVTAGKLLMITDFMAYTDQAGALLIRLQAAGTDILRGLALSQKGMELLGFETQPSAAAGQALTLLLPITTGIQNVHYNILGIEQ